MNDDTTSARSIHHGLTCRRGSLYDVIKVALNGSKPLPLRRGFGTCYHQNLHCSAAGSSNVGCQNAAVLHIQGSAVVQVLVNVSAPRNSAKRGRRGYVKILTISREGQRQDKQGDRQTGRPSAASWKSTKSTRTDKKC